MILGGALALAAALLAAPSGGAGDLTPALVLLLAGPRTEPLAGRLAAELLGVGFEVQREQLADEATPDPVGAALRTRAAAAVWVPPGNSAAEVWIIDRAAGRVSLRQSITAEGDELGPLVALRTVEFLRASLLGLPPTIARPTGALTPEPPVVVIQPPPPSAPLPPPRLTASVGVGLTASAGGIEPVTSLAIGIRVGLHGPLGIEALGLLPLRSAVVSSSDFGEASVSVWLTGAGLALRLVNRPRWSLDAGAGGLAIFVRTQGTPTSTEVQGFTSDAMGAAGYARLSAGLTLTSWLGARIEALGGSAFQRPVIGIRRQAGEPLTLASWGRPFGGGIVDVEARWR